MSENVYRDYKTPTQSGGLLKIQDGQTVRLRICSEPAIFNNDYKGTPSTRYAWVVWNVDEEAAQILNQSATFYRKIANLAQDEDWGDPQTYGIKVTREGSDTDTQYFVTPATAKSPLTDEQQHEIDKIDLLASLGNLPSATQVSWLADVIEQSQKSKEEGSIEGAKRVMGAKEDSDKPLDLSEIPFD